MTSPPVYILLVNYRNPEATLACLDSLRALDYADKHIVVIDNDSGDDSVFRFQRRLAEAPDEFHLLESRVNGGFSAGNNLGIHYALEQIPGEGYVWLLNNDTTVEPDALSALVKEAYDDSMVGSLLVYPDGTYQQIGTRVNWITGSTRGYEESDVTNGISVDCLSGASMLIPLAAVRRAGFMDESYFLYFEDGEYSLRLKQYGFSCHVAAHSRVYHAEGATTGRKSLSTQYYFHRNRLKMLFAFASPFQKVTIGAYAVFRLLRSVVKSVLNPSEERKASAKVHWLALYDFMKGIGGPCLHNLSNP